MVMDVEVMILAEVVRWLDRARLSYSAAKTHSAGTTASTLLKVEQQQREIERLAVAA